MDQRPVSTNQLSEYSWFKREIMDLIKVSNITGRRSSSNALLPKICWPGTTTKKENYAQSCFETVMIW